MPDPASKGLPCFVWVDTTRSWSNPHLGILIARRIEPDIDGKPHWRGWVISAYEGGSAAHGQRVYVTQMWHDYAHLKPVEGVNRPRPDLSDYNPVNSDRPT